MLQRWRVGGCVADGDGGDLGDAAVGGGEVADRLGGAWAGADDEEPGGGAATRILGEPLAAPWVLQRFGGAETRRCLTGEQRQEALDRTAEGAVPT